MTEEEILAALRGEVAAGPTGWRPPRTAWQSVTDPLKALFGVSGNIAAQVARPFLPEAYQAAAEEQARALGVGPESDLYEQAKALPNLGDVFVASGAVPEGLRGVTRFAGALVDPTNLVPVARAAGLGRGLGRAVAPIGRSLAGEGGANVAMRAAEAATALPFSAAAGLVYAPELAAGVRESGGTLVKALQQGDIGMSTQAALSLAAQAGLGLIVARGAAGEVGAARRALFPPRVDLEAAAAGAVPPPSALPSGAPPVAGVSPEVRAGRVAAMPGAPPVAAPTAQARVATATSTDVGVPGAGQGPLPAFPEPVQQTLAFPPAAAAAPPAPVAAAPLFPPVDVGALQADATRRAVAAHEADLAAEAAQDRQVQQLLLQAEQVPPERFPTPYDLQSQRVNPQTGILETMQASGGVGDFARDWQKFPERVEAPVVAAAAPPPAAPVVAAPPAAAEWKAGDSVEHPRYGSGVVEAAAPDNLTVRFGKKVVEIAPQAEGLKRLEAAGEAIPVGEAAPAVPAVEAPARPAEAPPAPIVEAAPDAVATAAREIADNPLAVDLELPEFKANVAKTYGLEPAQADEAIAAAQRMREAAGAAPAPSAEPGGPPPPASAATQREPVGVPRRALLGEPLLPGHAMAPIPARGEQGLIPGEVFVPGERPGRTGYLARIPEPEAQVGMTPAEIARLSKAEASARGISEEAWSEAKATIAGEATGRGSVARNTAAEDALRGRSFTEPVPPERQAKPDVGAQPPIPADLTPAQLKLVADNQPALQKMVNALARRYPGKAADAIDAAWNAVYASTKAFKEGAGKKFTSWAHDYAERDIQRLKPSGEGLEAAEVAAPGRPAAAASDAALANIDETIEKTPSMTRRAEAAREHLDRETKGAYSAAVDGQSYKEWAKTAGVTEGEAQAIFRTLGARARAAWEAAGLPVRGDAFDVGTLRIPESGANEIGNRAAGWAAVPDDIEPLAGLKGASPTERWDALPADYKEQIKRGLQRLAFGIRTGGERSPLREWIRLLESTDTIPAVKFGKEASIRRQAETVAREVFGVQPSTWFDDAAKQDFMRWLSSLEKAEREGLPSAWRPSDTPGLLKAATPEGPVIATVREIEGGNRVFEPAEKMWQARGAGEQIAGDEAKGVLARLGHLITKGDIPRGSLVAIPNDIRQFPKVWNDWRDRFLMPMDVATPGRQGNSTLYRVREVPGAPAHPKRGVNVELFGLQTTSELVGRGLKNAAEVLDHGLTLIGAGVRDFGAWSAKMLARFGDSISKWLEDVWVRVVDAGERWAEGRSQRTKDLLTFTFRTEPSRLGPARVPTEDAARAVREQAETAESLTSAAKLTDIPPERFLRASTAKAIEDELAFVLASDAPKIDVGKVKPSSPEGQLYDLGINLARVGDTPDRVKQGQAYLQRVMDIVADRATPKRTSEVIRQALPLLDQTPGEVVAQLERKLRGKLTYGEALTIRNLRDVLAKDYVAAKDEMMQASADFATGAITRADYDKSLAKAAAAQAKAGHTALLAANVGTYAGRLLAFQNILTSGGKFKDFKSRFVNGAREGLEISQEAAQQLYSAYEDLAARKISLSDYMVKLHAAAGYTPKDMVKEAIRSSMLTPLSPVAASASNELSFRLSRQEAQLGAHLAPITRKLFGYSDDLRAALGPEQANYPMPATLRRWAAAEAGKENAALLKDEVPRIALAQPFDPRQSGSIEGLRKTGGAIPGRIGEFVRSILKTLDMLDRHGQNRARAHGIAQHAWNEAVREAKKAGSALDMQSLMQSTFERIGLMREATDSDALFAKYGAERGTEILERYAEPLADVARDARRITFANALDKKEQPYFRGLARMGEVIGETFGKSIPGTMVFPFHRTPTNVAIASLMHTPFGFGQVQKALLEDRITPERWERDIMKPIIGTGIMAGVLPLALDGTITGGGPGDPKQEQLLRETGWQPYSVRIGDDYFSYQRLEPLAAILGFVGDIGDAIRRGDFKDEEGQFKIAKLAQRAAGSLADNLTSETFLAGLEGLFTAVHDPQRYGARFLKQLSGTLVPNSVGYIPVGSLGRAMDPYIRQTSIWTAPLAKVPLLNEDLPIQVGPTGAFRERTGSIGERLLSPFQRSSVQSDKESVVAQELDRLGYVPSRPLAHQEIGGRKIYYTQRELGQLDAAQRQATQELYRLVRSSSYRNAPEKESDPRAATTKTKKELIEAFYRKHRGQVQATLRPTLEKRLRQGRIGEAVR